MKKILGVFPLMKRLNEAASQNVPLEMVRDLSGLYEPEQINEICFQYKIWSYLASLEDCCEACGAHLPLGSKSTTKTCSNRCHQLVKRSTNKEEHTPIAMIRLESKERVRSIIALWEKSKQYPYKTAYSWHKVSLGWKVTSILNID